MPMSAKIFLYQEDVALKEIAEALRTWREEETFEAPGEDYGLLANVENVEYDEDELHGIYMYDSVTVHTWRGAVRPTPFTTEAPFVFTEQEGQRFVIVMAPKGVANRVANRLSTIIHGEQGAIVEPMIRTDNFNDFQAGTEATKIMLFDDIDLPNVDKGTLYGENVQQTDLYGNFVAHGRPWYMVSKTKQRGWTVGIVRDGTIVVFNTVDGEAFVEFLKEKIFPMTKRRSRE